MFNTTLTYEKARRIARQRMFDTSTARVLRSGGVSAGLVGLAGLFVAGSNVPSAAAMTLGMTAFFGAEGVAPLYERIVKWKTLRNLERLQKMSVGIQGAPVERQSRLCRVVLRGLQTLEGDLDRLWTPTEQEGKSARGVWCHTAQRILENILELPASGAWPSMLAEGQRLYRTQQRFMKWEHAIRPIEGDNVHISMQA